jgi:hypothetical protein
MKTNDKNPQFSAPAAPGPLFSEACRELARRNPRAFAKRPKTEALAAIRAAIAERPGSGTPAEAQAAARRAVTARQLADKVDAAPYFYPELFADALEAIGISTRAAIVETLRAYHRAAWHRARCEALKAATAAKRAARARAQYSARGEALTTAERRYIQLRAKAAAVTARDAARPQAGATPEENARAAAGYARLKAAGAFD